MANATSECIESNVFAQNYHLYQLVTTSQFDIVATKMLQFDT